MSNPFLAYEPPGRKPRPKQVKVVKSDADAPMKPTAMEKAQRDVSIQMRLHRYEWRKRLEAARGGKFGGEIKSLQKFFRRMTIEDGDALIDLVKRERLRDADQETRYMALRLVSNGLEKVRVQNGLPPFDDSLPGEPPTVFEIIRAELGVP